MQEPRGQGKRAGAGHGLEPARGAAGRGDRWPVAAAVLALSLVAGCQAGPKESAPASEPHRGGTAVLAIGEDLKSVNELLAGGATLSHDVTRRLLFLSLLVEQPDYREHPPTFAPSLAERYEWSSDHLVLTLHLRPHLVWSDGVPVTADDVRFTWQAQTNKAIAWEASYLKKEIQDVEVVDADTVRMHFAHAYSAQLVDANEGVILPKHAWGQLPFEKWRENADWFREHLVVDGPFTLASWARQQELVFARNPKYFDVSLPRLDRLVLRIVPDPSGRLEQFLAGQLDYLEQVPAAQEERIRAMKGAQLLSYWGRQYTFVGWNLRRPVFSDPDVRRALAMGIDRQRLIDALWRGHARLSSSPVINGVWAHNGALAPLPYDSAEARRILASKGWTDHDKDGIVDRGGVPLRFELLSNVGNSIRTDAAEMIQAQLRAIGVDAQPRQVDQNLLVERAGKHDYDAVIQGFTMDTTLDLTYAFGSESIEDGANWGGYSNPEIDRLLREAHAVAEPAQAKPLLDKIQEILYRDQPLALLWEPERLDAASARLRGVQPNALSAFFNVEEWWIQN